MWYLLTCFNIISTTLLAYKLFSKQYLCVLVVLTSFPKFPFLQVETVWCFHVTWILTLCSPFLPNSLTPASSAVTEVSHSLGYFCGLDVGLNALFFYLMIPFWKPLILHSPLLVEAKPPFRITVVIDSRRRRDKRKCCWAAGWLLMLEDFSTQIRILGNGFSIYFFQGMLYFFLHFLRWIFKMCMPEPRLKGRGKRRSRNDWITFTKKKPKELKKKWQVKCFGSFGGIFVCF